jgi:hypothetical protein
MGAIRELAEGFWSGAVEPARFWKPTGHLIDWAVAAEPVSRDAHAARAAIYEIRGQDAAALMTRGIFLAAARESAARAAAEPP